MNDAVHNKYFVIVTSNSSRSGSYQPHYFVIVDPAESKVVYESPNEFISAYDKYYEFTNRSDIHLNMQMYNLYSDCSNCRLSMDEYISFDPKSGKFLPVNHKYKSYFESILKSYEAMGKREKCTYKGEELTIDELIKKHGGSANCAGDVIYENTPEFMTMGEFIQYKDNISKIISGEKLSLME